jgi:hypothetical protein
MVPAPFRRLAALRTLNVAGVGLSLAAIVSSAFTRLFEGDAWCAFSTALPTVVVGSFWAALLRSKTTFGQTSMRLGWVASIPLASLNAALASALFLANPGPRSSLLDPITAALVGATYGAIFWIPCLVCTLILFGAPISRAQRLAERGLAGEERGEIIVAASAAGVSLGGLALALDGPIGRQRYLGDGRHLVIAIAIAAIAVDLFALGLSLARAMRRRRFVRDAEAGNVTGFRVDDTRKGKVLVRIVSQGQGYRVADFEEDIFEIAHARGAESA